MSARKNGIGIPARPEPPDDRTYLGVDVGLRRVSVAAVRGREYAVSTYTVSADQTLAATLADLAYVAAVAARYCVKTFDRPTSVIVEQPSGRYVNPALCYAVGVVLSELNREFPNVTHDLPPSTWKKAACGRGNASKADHMVIARSCGYRGDIEDEADAICIALAARKLTTVEVSGANSGA